MLNSVEHEKSFITSGPGLNVSQCIKLGIKTKDRGLPNQYDIPTFISNCCVSCRNHKQVMICQARPYNKGNQ